MNIFAFVHLQKYIARQVSERIGKTVQLGRFVDMSDSYHIYGSRHEFFQGFLEKVKTSDFSERVYNYHDEMIKTMFDEARTRDVPGNLRRYKESHKTGFYER
jgi:thymidylate synthase